MCSIAQGIHEARNVIRNSFAELKDIVRRKAKVFSKSPWTIHSNPIGFPAQMSPPRAAIAAETTCDVALTRHPCSNRQASHFRT